MIVESREIRRIASETHHGNTVQGKRNSGSAEYNDSGKWRVDDEAESEFTRDSSFLLAPFS